MALSHRADELSRPEPGFRFFEILENQWDSSANPDGFVNLGVAENTLMHNELLAKINHSLDIPSSALTYGDGQKRLKASVAHFLTRKFNTITPIEACHISAVNGCTTAIQNLSWALANPGDIILIGRPYYGGMPVDVSRRTATQLVPVSFGFVDPTSLGALQKYEEAILAARERRQRVAALLLVNPHNPLGRCYPRNVLEEFMRLCQRHRIHLISNEIYGLTTYSTAGVAVDDSLVTFESILSINPEGLIDPSLVHMLWGMSKDFGANGLRIGFTVSQHNEKLHKALLSVFEFSWSSAVTDLITATILEDDAWVDWYIVENQRKLAAQHELVVRWAKNNGIEYAPSSAGFFLWVNLGAVYLRYQPRERSINVDEEVMEALLARKVFLADGVRFGAEQSGWLRIVFSHHSDYLFEGLNRILLAISTSTNETRRLSGPVSNRATWPVLL